MTPAIGAMNCSLCRASVSRFSRTVVFMVSFPFVKCSAIQRRLIGLNLNLFRFGFLGFGQRHRQDAVAIVRIDFACVHAHWQPDATAEFADVTFGALGLLAIRSLTLAFACDRERPV